MSRPLLLDAFCGGGGATRGYQDAGWHVTGLDVVASPNYCGDAFVKGDALELLGAPWFIDQFDAIACSPPCQGYSVMSACRPGLAEAYPKLIEPVRELLTDWGGFYVIENVPGSPLKDPVELCGQMFGLELYRHRLFETNWPLTQPEHPQHTVPASKAGHWKPGTIMSVSGHVAPIAHARRVMGIDWTTREELAEAIPPAYTSYVGAALLEHLGATCPTS